MVLGFAGLDKSSYKENHRPLCVWAQKLLSVRSGLQRSSDSRLPALIHIHVDSGA